MKKLLLILLAILSLQVNAQDKKIDFKDIFKFGTVYGAVNGGTSLSDEMYIQLQMVYKHQQLKLHMIIQYYLE